MIDKDILIEDLVTRLPKAVGYLMKKNIKCLACGEPIWGTLEQAAKQKGFSDTEIAVFVRQDGSSGRMADVLLAAQG